MLFVENLTEQALKDRSNLDNKIATNIQEQILNSAKLNINDAFKITDETVLTSVKNLLNEHVSWLEVGSYKMLITISDAAKKDSSVSQKGYSFRLWEGQLAGLKENQPKSYKYPPKVRGNLFFSFSAVPLIVPLLNEDLLSLIKAATG